MRQEDFILREIEKIGTLLMALMGKMKKSGQSTAISTGEQMNASRELLKEELGFDLDKFMLLKEDELGPYLSEFQGMNTANRECLADLLKEMGEKAGSGLAHLEKALAMYELCKIEDKTFSFDRERKIGEIQQLLQ